MVWIMDEWAHLPLDQHHSHVIIIINFKQSLFFISLCKYIVTHTSYHPVTPLHHIILSNYPTNKWHGLAQHWAVDSWHDGWWLHVLPPMPIIQITHPIMDFLNNLDTDWHAVTPQIFSFKMWHSSAKWDYYLPSQKKCFHILLRSNICIMGIEIRSKIQDQI